MHTFGKSFLPVVVSHFGFRFFITLQSVKFFNRQFLSSVLAFPSPGGYLETVVRILLKYLMGSDDNIDEQARQADHFFLTFR